jgi:hypothetical protein
MSSPTVHCTLYTVHMRLSLSLKRVLYSSAVQKEASQKYERRVSSHHVRMHRQNKFNSFNKQLLDCY